MNRRLVFGGRGNRGDIVLDLEFWIMCQRDLATADALMELIAIGTDWKLATDLRGIWPARRLVRKSVLAVEELRLELNPNFLEDGLHHYELSRIVAPRASWTSWLGARSQCEDLGRLSREEVASVEELKRLLEPTAGRVWQPRVPESSAAE